MVYDFKSNMIIAETWCHGQVRVDHLENLAHQLLKWIRENGSPNSVFLYPAPPYYGEGRGVPELVINLFLTVLLEREKVELGDFSLLSAKQVVSLWVFFNYSAEYLTARCAEKQRPSFWARWNGVSQKPVFWLEWFHHLQEEEIKELLDHLRCAFNSGTRPPLGVGLEKMRGICRETIPRAAFFYLVLRYWLYPLSLFWVICGSFLLHRFLSGFLPTIQRGWWLALWFLWRRFFSKRWPSFRPNNFWEKSATGWERKWQLMRHHVFLHRDSER